MSRPLPFTVEPWSISLEGLHAEALAQSESIFALSNGHLGWRGTLDEGEPHGQPGSYLNGVYESHRMPYAESGYGYPRSGDTIVDIPDGTIIRLLVDDEPLDLRTGELLHHQHTLDFRSGTLRRESEWRSPTGVTIRLASTRLVSLTQRSVGAIRYEVEALERATSVSIQSEIVADDPRGGGHSDPQVSDTLERPFEAIAAHHVGSRATLLHRTRESRVALAVAMDHRLGGSAHPVTSTEVSPYLARTTITADLDPGERLSIDKFIGHEWSKTLSTGALRDRAEAALAEGLRAGFDGLVESQRDYLGAFWARADVVIDGDASLQQAVRLALFHVVQASARAEGRPIPGKGLTGSGYGGNSFWDSESFVLPVLDYLLPDAAGETLRWRHATLPLARERAAQLHLDGAAFPWRTIEGDESSGYWPAGTVAFHINADIAAAVLNHIRVTGDLRFEREVGLDLLVETARLWSSLGHFDDRGDFHIDGVTGPDEYSAIADDNVYTNVMAQQNLRAAADLAERHPDGARMMGVSEHERALWRRAASAMTVLYDEQRGVHPQAAGFTAHERWDFDATPPDRYPLQNHHPYFDLYRKQVVKQADLVLALYFRHDAFTLEQKTRDFAYYEELTVRDSSLSAGVQAVIAAEVGHLELAACYLTEAARMDIDDLHDDTADGLHIASLAGVWTAVTAGFGGLRHDDGGLHFAPRLPPSLTGISFGLAVTGRELRLSIRENETEYALSAGAPLTVTHFAEPVQLEVGQRVSLPTPPLPSPGPQPTQPRGRSPRAMFEDD